MAMQIPFGNIEGFTREMAKDQPEYQTLPIRDETWTYPNAHGDPIQVSVMTCMIVPTPEQITAMQNGEPLFLSIFGVNWPPVSLSVGDPAKEDQS